MLDTTTIINTIAAIAIPFGGLSPILVQIFKYVQKINNGKDYDQIKKYCNDAVMYSRDLGINNTKLDGNQLLTTATTWASDKLKTKGINLSETDLEGYVRSAYTELSKDWKDASADNITPVTPIQPIVDNVVVIPQPEKPIVPVVPVINTNELTIPTEMLQEVYANLEQKALSDAKNAINMVVADVNKIVAPTQPVVPVVVQPITPITPIEPKKEDIVVPTPTPVVPVQPEVIPPIAPIITPILEPVITPVVVIPTPEQPIIPNPVQ